MRKFLSAVFAVLMLLCTLVFIWHAPASTLLSRTIDNAKDELAHEKKLLQKQVEVDHIEALDDVRTYQDELDALFSPELDELWRHDQTIKTLKNEKSELQSEITSRKAEKKALEEWLKDPKPQRQVVPQDPESSETEPAAAEPAEPEPAEPETAETPETEVD